MVLALIQPHVRLLTGKTGYLFLTLRVILDLSRHSRILEKNPPNLKTYIPLRKRYAPRVRERQKWLSQSGYTPWIHAPGCPKGPCVRLGADMLSCGGRLCKALHLSEATWTFYHMLLLWVDY